MKRFILILLFLSFSFCGFADELIVDFKEDSVPVLNEELRKIQETNASLQSQIDALEASVGDASPTGSVVSWTTDTAPTGWILCDGSAVSRSTYSGLYAVIGVVFGVGDGSTTFNVPDLIGRVVVMKDASDTRLTNADAIADSGGAEDGVATHSHTVGVKNDWAGYYNAYPGYYGVGEPDVTLTSSSTGTADGNLQPYLTLVYIIKT